MKRLSWILLLDVLAVLAFALAGRRSHHEGTAAAHVVQTALPFLGGTAVGWVASRAWLRPWAWRTALIVWPCTVVLGLVLRVAFTDGGAPASFAMVATVALGVLLVGWRAVAHVIGARTSRRHAEVTR